MKVMHDMELDDEDKMDMSLPIPMPEKPDYPCNLRFSLTDREFRKMPEVDPKDAVVEGMFHFYGMARITHVSHSEDGKICVECCMTSLGIESEDAENEGE